MPQEQFPTAIVGANPLLRESLSKFLHESAFKIAGLASSFEGLATETLPQDSASLLIIDACDHPGEACSQIERFSQDFPKGRSVVLANHCAPSDIVRVLRSGAHGYFATIATCEDFIKSLELVMSGQTVVPSDGLNSVLVREASQPCEQPLRQDNAPLENRRPIGAEDIPQFSPRELFILRGLTEGSSNKVIAREYDIAEGTVKVHVKAILRKIKVQNRTQAAIWALNNRSQIWPRNGHAQACPEQGPPPINIQLGTQTIDTSWPETAAANGAVDKPNQGSLTYSAG